MKNTRSLEIGTGLFVLLGFCGAGIPHHPAAGHVAQVRQRAGRVPVTAKFDNIGDLKAGSPVTMAGVHIGRVESIRFDPKDFKAAVVLRIEEQYSEIPEDSDASIQTAGLLGGKYIGIGPGGSETFLKDGGQIEFTQSAIVLESLVNKFFANMAEQGIRRHEERGAGRQRATGAEMMQSVKRFIQAGFIVRFVRRGAAAGGPDRQCRQNRRRKPVPTAVDTSGPSQLIESSANVILGGIDARRAEFRKDPTGLYKLVDKTLLPHFDTPYAAQLVLGKHWRNATPEQRKRFVEAFYKSLLYTYGDAMVDFTADRLKVFPTKVAPTDERATVRTEIKRSNGTKVAVNYSHAQGQRRVEGLGRGHRRHQLREELPRGLRRRGRAEGTGCRDRAARGQGRERQGRKGENNLNRMTGEAATSSASGSASPAPGRVVVTGELTFATARNARELGLLVLEGSRAERIVIDCAASRARTARDLRCCSTGWPGAGARSRPSRCRTCRPRCSPSRASARWTAC